MRSSCGEAQACPAAGASTELGVCRLAPLSLLLPLDRALLIQRADNGHWEPPGGVLELGETIDDGLRREVREETGLDVEPIALTGVYKNMTRGIVALVFRCKITGGQLAASKEASGFRWASETDVRELASEAYAIRVLDAVRPERAPSVRAHDGTRLV